MKLVVSNQLGYQFKITLREVKPVVWRRLIVPAELTLHDLHKIIQTTMGWTNSHHHNFTKDKAHYSAPESADDDEWMSTGESDSRKVILKELISVESDKLLYTYDFGDNWEHDIFLEKIIPLEPDVFYPVCTDGKMACPPEDCGGVPGYEDLCRVLKNPKHPDYAELIDWLGDVFDPAYFDPDEVNEFLREPDFGTFSD